MSVPIYNSGNPEQYLSEIDSLLASLTGRIDTYAGLPTPTNELFTQMLAPLEESVGCAPCDSS